LDQRSGSGIGVSFECGAMEDESVKEIQHRDNLMVSLLSDCRKKKELLLLLDEKEFLLQT